MLKTQMFQHKGRIFEICSYFLTLTLSFFSKPSKTEQRKLALKPLAMEWIGESWEDEWFSWLHLVEGVKLVSILEHHNWSSNQHAASSWQSIAPWSQAQSAWVVLAGLVPASYLLRLSLSHTFAGLLPDQSYYQLHQQRSSQVPSNITKSDNFYLLCSYWDKHRCRSLGSSAWRIVPSSLWLRHKAEPTDSHT